MSSEKIHVRKKDKYKQNISYKMEITLGYDRMKAL
jgi:hypothetical protein